MPASDRCLTIEIKFKRMRNKPYNVIYEELPEQAILKFSGQLIINYIEKIAELVNKKLNTEKDLQIEIDNPESIDITFVQLVLAIKSTLQVNSRKITITGNLKEENLTLIRNAGFNIL